jgi:transcriptional regulator with XRE-family HTH domain
MNYANLMKLYINKHGITQGEFGKRAGLERGRVNKIMLGRKHPNPPELVKLEKFFADQKSN